MFITIRIDAPTIQQALGKLDTIRGRLEAGSTMIADFSYDVTIESERHVPYPRRFTLSDSCAPFDYDVQGSWVEADLGCLQQYVAWWSGHSVISEDAHVWLAAIGICSDSLTVEEAGGTVTISWKPTGPFVYRTYDEYLHTQEKEHDHASRAD